MIDQTVTEPATALGRTHWAFSLDAIPINEHGPEPAFSSRHTLCVSNTGARTAHVRVQVCYAEQDPVGLFRLTVAPRRLRRFRINDLIFPQALLLDVPYALDLCCDVPIVVQLTAQDTRQRALARMGTLAYPQ